jgi:hypothetical protein
MTGVGNPVSENVIFHLSPFGWQHITFTGSYHWREHAGDINVLRPLLTFKLEKNGRGILPRHQDHWAQAIPLNERAEAVRP